MEVGIAMGAGSDCGDGLTEKEAQAPRADKLFDIESK
jgi:hypothetical protein